MISLGLFAAFLSPQFYAIAILAITGAYLLHRGFVGGHRFPRGTGALLSIWAIFAVLAILGPTFSYGRSGQNAEALKFVVAGFAFVLGIGVANQMSRIAVHLLAFVGALTAAYAVLNALEITISQDALLYPTDNNHSAAMVAIMLPLIVFRTSGWTRTILLALAACFSFLVASRALLALSVVAIAISPAAVRDRKWLLALAVPVALAILVLRDFSLNNFSDQLRLQILTVSFDYAVTRGAHAFNFGETAFTNFLNIYPIYRRLEIQHAHNILLQIWVAYGIAPLVVFSVFMVGLVVNAVRQFNQPLIAQLAILLLFGMIEALITDVRAFGTIMLLLGWSFGRYGAADTDQNQIPSVGERISDGQPQAILR